MTEDLYGYKMCIAISQKASTHLKASKEEKRVIRKKSKKYSVSNGQLTYRTKKGNNVKVIFSEEERKRILNSCHTDS